MEVQKDIMLKKLKFYSIDANEGAQKTGMGGALKPVCRPASSPSRVFSRVIWPIAEIKKSIKKTYGKRGEAVVQRLRSR